MSSHTYTKTLLIFGENLVNNDFRTSELLMNSDASYFS